MHPDLQFLLHFFNVKAYLFKTITMAGPAQADAICDQISSQKGWFWPRFSPIERQPYLQRRRFVEYELYNDYTQEYGGLKEKIPVYFYLYPNITRRKAIEMAHQRVRSGESAPKILFVKVEDIEDTSNMTFTINDSHTAYWQKAVDAGIPCRGDRLPPVVLPDHNKVFPFSMLEELHRKYQAQQVNYEIQVWDYQMLENLKYTVIERSNAR